MSRQDPGEGDIIALSLFGIVICVFVYGIILALIESAPDLCVEKGVDEWGNEWSILHYEGDSYEYEACVEARDGE